MVRLKAFPASNRLHRRCCLWVSETWEKAGSLRIDGIRGGFQPRGHLS
ncbi:MAG: hypothetical protein J6Y37_06330 [Paludibacteraceae bacterium]|nr:hypothetical protein [Paludibacteraceae bacterium]